MAENVKCVFCNSSLFTNILEARDPDMISEESYHLVRCNGCGLIFNNPRPTEEELSKFYTQQYYGRIKVYPFNFIEKLLIWFQELRVRKVRKIIQSGRLLDVGCGKGTFLKCLLNRGFEVYGVEPSVVNQQDPCLRELNIASGSLNDLCYPAAFFDVVTLWHVFEHISDPRRLLREIRRIIKPESILIMAVPNFGSLEARIAGRNWFHLDLPRHLYHYTAITLEKMLKVEGFKLIKIDYFSLEFGPFGLLQTIMNILGGEFNFLAKALKGYPLNKFQIKRKYYTLGLFLFIFPFLPLIVLFSSIEACCRKGGILEIYAKADK